MLKPRQNTLLQAGGMGMGELSKGPADWRGSRCLKIRQIRQAFICDCLLILTLGPGLLFREVVKRETFWCRFVSLSIRLHMTKERCQICGHKKQKQAKLAL